MSPYSAYNLIAVVKGEHEIGPAGRARVRWDPDSRLMLQPSRNKAAKTRRALAAPHVLVRPRTTPMPPRPSSR